MKKIKLLTLMLLCMALLCACGNENAAPTEAPAEETPVPMYENMLRISEVMIKNRATVLSDDGSFPDWVELENISGEVVELTDWAISDSGDEYRFESGSIAPGELMLIELDSLGASFALSAGEALYLYSPDGAEADRADCPDTDADCSIIRTEDGGFDICLWPSPGYENSSAGYEDYCAGISAPGPIVINEVAVYTGEDSDDWLEIKNISAETVALQDFFISDDHKDYHKQPLPQRSLLPGESLLFYCVGDETESYSDLNLAFSISADREELFLSHAENGLIDYVSLHSIPLYGSMGRIDGANGFFYFDTPTPGHENAGGLRRVSAAPESSSTDGVFDAGTVLSFELQSPGSIYYTTDGSYPSTASNLYSGPISISQTCVVRAIAIEDGALPSRPLTMSYFIGENHGLPVISLVQDDLTFFNNTYDSMLKDINMPASVAFYDGDRSFKKDCFTSLKGWTSLVLPKKSLGVSFESVLGGELEYDVFNNGIELYSDLSIRAGQDYQSSVIRTELFQQLCYDMESPVLNQESIYSVLYINGEYRGIYCLKEDFTKQYYASHAGVSKDSVEGFRAPSGPEVDFFNDVFMYCWYKDMSLPENYEYVCSKVDIDSLIDWFIIEGFSGNTDTQGNLRFYRSSENGNKWTFALYDLDWGFINPYNAYTLLINGGGNVGGEMPTILWSLLNNQDFRDRLVSRFAELNKTVLSNEHVLQTIDKLAAIVEPEIPRDRERWGMETEKWYEEVEALRRFIIDNDYETFSRENFIRCLNLSEEEIAKHFG